MNIYKPAWPLYTRPLFSASYLYKANNREESLINRSSNHWHVSGWVLDSGRMRPNLCSSWEGQYSIKTLSQNVTPKDGLGYRSKSPKFGLVHGFDDWELHVLSRELSTLDRQSRRPFGKPEL